MEFIKNTVKPDGLVLDVACGSGRHLIPLSKEGYSVVGLDISRKLLKIAKSRWQDAVVVRADMRFLPFKQGAFAAAVSLDTSFGYLPSPRDEIQSLSELHMALGRDGILVVDVFNREHLIQHHSESSEPKWLEYPSFYLKQTRTVTADGGFLRDVWTVRDKADGQTRVFEHVARLYTLSQLQTMLEKAGFKVTAVYGDYEEQVFSADSSRFILVADSTEIATFSMGVNQD